jgi:hypothetical protein
MTEKRRADRVPLKCEVEFRRHGDARFQVDLIDLSPTGCCIAPPVKVQPGESIYLRIPGKEAIHAKVMWVEEWRVGAQFDRPIYEPVFDDLVRRLGGGA